jgi:uncharacterized protein YndB with AHSA1/START domain
MDPYDLIDEAVIAAPPAAVWDALVAELSGAARWWLPRNTYRVGAVPPDRVGGEVRVGVHPNGVGKPGPVLRFTARTNAVEPRRRLALEYVDGVFRGTAEFTLTPVDEGRATRLAMHFVAEPSGWVKLLARVKDVGLEHSRGTQEAFGNLNVLLAGSAVTR